MVAVALTFSTVAITYAFPGLLPAVNVVVADPLEVVKDAAPSVPRLDVKVTGTPSIY